MFLCVFVCVCLLACVCVCVFVFGDEQWQLFSHFINFSFHWLAFFVFFLVQILEDGFLKPLGFSSLYVCH